VVLAAPAALADLAALCGAVDRVLPTEGLGALDFPDRPEVAVNLHGRGPQSHQALLDLHPAELVAFASPLVGNPGPLWDAEEHEVNRWCRLIAEAWCAEVHPSDLLLRPPDKTYGVPAGAVVIHPGAAFESRRWGVERFAAVAQALHRAGERVVVTGAPSEVGLAEQVRDRAGLPAAAVLAGRTDLLALASLVCGARLVVCGDTGIAHLASAYATPSVVLFGPTAPARWGPPSSGPHVVLWHGTGQGDPWADDVDPALMEISVDEVLDQLAVVIGEPALASTGNPT